MEDYFHFLGPVCKRKNRLFRLIYKTIEINSNIHITSKILHNIEYKIYKRSSIVKITCAKGHSKITVTGLFLYYTKRNLKCRPNKKHSD